jgi:hypothetical protein
MYLDPDAINGAVVGYLNTFNLTVYFNVTAHPEVPNNGANSWQFYMVYKKDLLNATACVYSGAGGLKSLWAGALPVDTVSPSFGSHNATYNYVLLSEVLKNSAEKDGPAASLAIVTFKIIKAPGKHENLTSDIRLDNPGIFASIAQDSNFNFFTLNFGKAVYTWNWVTPANATLFVAPSAVTKGGPPPTVIGQTFAVDVNLTIDAGWACHNVSFTLNNDNITLLTVSAYAVNPLWTSYVVTNATNAAIVVFVSTPSSTPSGTVRIIKITYRILDQGIDPRTYIAHLTFSGVLVYDTTSTIPLNALNSCLVTIKGLQTRIPAYLQVSSVTMGPGPVLGQVFNVTVKVMNLDSGWFLIGLDFRLSYDISLMSFVQGWEGPFLPYYSTKQNGSLGTWYVVIDQPGDPFYGDHVIYGDLIFPNSSGLWPRKTKQYPNSNVTVPAVCGNTVAILQFRVEYQSFGEANLTAPFNIIDEHWVGIEAPNATDQNIVYLQFNPPHNGTYTITTHWPGRMIDAYTQYPAPYGGQGLNMPSDMFWPQKTVELCANVTYNYWPVQQKDVAFEIRDPHGNLWKMLTARTDVNGVACASFLIPWPCDHPEDLFGVWTIYATVDIACTVVNDTIRFHFDYMVEIFSVTTDKFQYNHCDNVKVTITFGTHAQQYYPLLLYTVIEDNLGVPVGIALVNMTIGGTVFCQYKNYTVEVSIHIPKFAFAGIATVEVTAYNKLPSQGGSAWCPMYGDGWPIGATVPEIAIQPY